MPGHTHIGTVCLAGFHFRFLSSYAVSRGDVAVPTFQTEAMDIMLRWDGSTSGKLMHAKTHA